MVARFTIHSPAQTVIFGEGHLEVLARTGKRAHPFIVSTPGHAAAAERIAAALGKATVCPLARMHTPIAVTDEAFEALVAAGADSLVAIGGGSAIGLSKALALRTGLPQTAIPTTYAGSEMTPVLGQTRDGRKTTLRDERVRPGTVIYDVELTLTLPPGISAASGMNGLAHAVEALYAPDRSPLTELAAAEAARLFRASLPAIVNAPLDREARSQALEAAYLAGFALGQTTMGLHHKLAHVLGGALDLPHAQTHAVLLPYVAAFNEDYLGALGPAPGKAISDLADAIGTPRTLAALGMAQGDIDEVVSQTLASLPANPREITPANLRALLEAAWAGEPV